MTWTIALISAGASLLGAVVGAGISVVLYVLRSRAERASRFESQIIDGVTRSLHALDKIGRAQVLPRDDAATKEAKSRASQAAYLEIRKIIPELQLLCRSGDVPRALHMALQTVPREPDDGAELKARNRLIDAAKKELGVPNEGLLHLGDVTLRVRDAPEWADN